MDENYKVECKGDSDYSFLSVTHNGLAWTSIRIDDPEHEIPLMIKVLENKLKEVKDESRN